MSHLIASMGCRRHVRGSSASPVTPLAVPAVQAQVGGTTSRGGSQSGDNE